MSIRAIEQATVETDPNSDRIVTIHPEPGLQGERGAVFPGDSNLPFSPFSLKVPLGMVILLFKGEDQRGDFIRLEPGEHGDLSVHGFAGVAKSARVFEQAKILIFDGLDFSGDEDTLHEGKHADLSEGRVGSDRVSSVQVCPGTYAKFFLTRGFRDGSFLLFEGDYRTLDHLQNHVGSVQVFPHDSSIFPVVKLYSQVRFGGTNLHLAGTGPVTDLDMSVFLNNRIQSVIVPKGVTLVLFDGAQGAGRSLELEPGEYPDLNVFGFRGITSSARIIQSGLEVIKIEYGQPIFESGDSPEDDIFIQNTVDNDSSLAQRVNLKLERGFEQSVSRSFENSTLAGLEVSTSASATAGFLGGEVSVEQTVTASLETSFTIGKEETSTSTLVTATEVSLTVPPNKRLDAKLRVQPRQGKINAVYTLRLKGTTEVTTQNVVIEFKTFEAGEVIIAERPLFDPGPPPEPDARKELPAARV